MSVWLRSTPVLKACSPAKVMLLSSHSRLLSVELVCSAFDNAVAPAAQSSEETQRDSFQLYLCSQNDCHLHLSDVDPHPSPKHRGT